MISLPFISVVVPTFNRVGMLPGLIAALKSQNYPSDRYEILCVDDGSDDGTLAYLSNLKDTHVRVLSQDHGGASRARNLAATNARGEILAFTDDDCLPDPSWLKAIGESWVRHGPNTALLGHTYSEHPSGTFIHSVFKDSEPVVTCNFAVPRAVFEKIGGFDPHFILYFEDEDLGLRIRKSGTPIIYEPAMRVLHPSKYQSFRGFLRLRSGLQYFCYMSQKHPDCDHWIRHRGVTRQILKRTAIVGIPVVAGILWAPAFLVLLGVLVLFVLRDAKVAARYRRELAGRGFQLRVTDMLAFALLNWSVPFLDGARILKGYALSYGEVTAWTAVPARPGVPAPHLRGLRAIRMLLRKPGSLASRVYRRLRLRLPHAPRQLLRLGDVRLELDVRDPNMKSMFEDLYEVDDIAFLKKLLRAGDTVFDVGANIGYLAAVSASLVGRTGQVHAFEPAPELYGRLERLKGLNPDFNIRLSNVAAGAKADWLSLSLSKDGNRGWNTLVPGFMPEAGGSVRVPVVPLDQYLGENGIQRLDFVKVDVEGFEFPVLLGMRQALGRLRPTVLCEVAPEAYPRVGHGIEELESFLEDMGYRSFDVRMNPVRIRELTRTENVVLLPRHRLRF